VFYMALGAVVGVTGHKTSDHWLVWIYIG